MKLDFRCSRYDGYCFGSLDELDAAVLAQLARAIGRPAAKSSAILGGRGYITSARIEGLGAVVIKHYKRGGLLRFLMARRYLRLAKLRPQVEFEVMAWVRTLGVCAPEPVAFITKGSFFYRGWLVTKEIPKEESLAAISLMDEPRACRLVSKLTQQISLMIRHGVYHVDLHPGNVLVDFDDNVFLLDFDKARIWKGRKNGLRDSYIYRWRRAVIKHGLPDLLSEWLCAELRKDYDQ
jgi:tRNA A-37 threonylcarbamoyl transferase component Bud32